jgi:BASS family bile acid:Na+ symporter
VKILIDVSVPVMTFLLLSAVGMDLTSDDFRRVRRQPAILLAGLVAPVALLPAVAVGLIVIFRPPADVAGALLLVAVCPIGGISNLYSYLARASPALSVSLTGLSCLMAGVTMPVLGQVISLASGTSIDLALPIGTLLTQLLLMLYLPVALGMWARRRRPELAARYRPVLQRLSFAGVGIVLTLIVLDDPPAFAGGLANTVPLAAAFIVCSGAAGWLTAALVTADLRDRFTVTVEFGTRNLGVAMAVAVTLLGRVEFARFAYTYFLTEIPLALLAIAWFRRAMAAPAAGIRERMEM